MLTQKVLYDPSNPKLFDRRDITELFTLSDGGPLATAAASNGPASSASTSDAAALMRETDTEWLHPEGRVDLTRNGNNRSIGNNGTGSGSKRGKKTGSSSSEEEGEVPAAAVPAALTATRGDADSDSERLQQKQEADAEAERLQATSASHLVAGRLSTFRVVY